MHEPLAVMGTPGVGFFSLIIIGGLAGWIAGMIIGVRHGIFTNILIGIAGSWIGSELADLAHIAVRDSIGHFVAALVGSVALLYHLAGRSTSAPERAGLTARRRRGANDDRRDRSASTATAARRRPRHPEKAHRPDQPSARKPAWIRVKAPGSRRASPRPTASCASTSSSPSARRRAAPTSASAGRRSTPPS